MYVICMIMYITLILIYYSYLKKNLYYLIFLIIFVINIATI